MVALLIYIPLLVDGFVLTMLSTNVVRLAFNLPVPKNVNSVPSKILNPRFSWADKDAYDKTAKVLAQKFIDNFVTYTDTDLGKKLVAAGPQV